jgi:hypothetical protein
MSVLPFYLHGLMLALVWFAITAGAATLVVAAIARQLIRQEAKRPASFWLALRVIPAAAAASAVAVLFVPSYWLYEPRQYAEGFHADLAGVGLLALAAVAVPAARGGAAWIRASRRATAWAQMGTPIATSGASMPAFRIETEAPIMALVGIVNPRLFISRRVVSALNEEELAASVAHEVGHRCAFDNFKRLLLLSTPSFLTPALTRQIDERWAAAAEEDADRRACQPLDTGAVRYALASAIVKIARMLPAPPIVAEPISTLVDGSDIEARVHSLLEADVAAERPRRDRRRLMLTLAIGAIAAAAAGYAPLLRAVHEATEVIVHAIQ